MPRKLLLRCNRACWLSSTGSCVNTTGSAHRRRMTHRVASMAALSANVTTGTVGGAYIFAI